MLPDQRALHPGRMLSHRLGLPRLVGRPAVRLSRQRGVCQRTLPSALQRVDLSVAEMLRQRAGQRRPLPGRVSVGIGVRRGPLLRVLWRVGPAMLHQRNALQRGPDLSEWHLPAHAADLYGPGSADLRRRRELSRGVDVPVGRLLRPLRDDGQFREVLRHRRRLRRYERLLLLYRHHHHSRQSDLRVRDSLHRLGGL